MLLYLSGVNGMWCGCVRFLLKRVFCKRNVQVENVYVYRTLIYIAECDTYVNVLFRTKIPTVT